MISFITAGRYGRYGAERHKFEPGPLPIIFASPDNFYQYGLHYSLSYFVS